MRILCFGDSNTYGYDPRGFYGDRYEAENRWVDLLGTLTGHEVINAGTNGREIPHVSYSRSLELAARYGCASIALSALRRLTAFWPRSWTFPLWIPAAGTSIWPLTVSTSPRQGTTPLLKTLPRK